MDSWSIFRLWLGLGAGWSSQWDSGQTLVPCLSPVGTHWCSVSALLCPELGQDGQRCPIFLWKQSELPSLFSESSALIEFHRKGTGTCSAALQAPVRKQEQKYSFFYALHSTTRWCGVFLWGVLFLLPLLVFVCTSLVSVPYKDYH